LSLLNVIYRREEGLKEEYSQLYGFVANAENLATIGTLVRRLIDYFSFYI